MTISDIIEAKQRILARYETPEYISKERLRRKTLEEIERDSLLKDIGMTDLLSELLSMELAAQKATTPVNIEEKE